VSRRFIVGGCRLRWHGSILPIEKPDVKSTCERLIRCAAKAFPDMDVTRDPDACQALLNLECLSISGLTSVVRMRQALITPLLALVTAYKDKFHRPARPMEIYGSHNHTPAIIALSFTLRDYIIRRVLSSIYKSVRHAEEWRLDRSKTPAASPLLSPGCCHGHGYALTPPSPRRRFAAVGEISRACPRGVP